MHRCNLLIHSVRRTRPKSRRTSSRHLGRPTITLARLRTWIKVTKQGRCRQGRASTTLMAVDQWSSYPRGRTMLFLSKLREAVKITRPIWTLQVYSREVTIKFTIPKTSLSGEWATLQTTLVLQRRAQRTQLMAALAPRGQSTQQRTTSAWALTTDWSKSWASTRLRTRASQPPMFSVYLCRSIPTTWPIRAFHHKNQPFKQIKFSTQLERERPPNLTWLIEVLWMQGSSQQWSTPTEAEC